MLTLLCGLPGSGKTTWRDRHLGDAYLVCLDDIREEVTGDPGSQDRNEEVLRIARSRLASALSAGRDAVVDATNLTRKHRRAWIELARQYGVSCRCVWVAAPKEVALERNASRQRRVPEHVIERMAREFEAPTAEEGFESIQYVGATD